MMARLNRAWRIFSTGICFAIFGIGGIIIALALFPIIGIISGNDAAQRKAVQRTICWVFKRFVSIMQFLGVMELTKIGANSLAGAKGEIIIANHPTLIDVVLIGSMLDEFDCIVKEALWQNPALKGVVSAADFIPNSTGDELIQECMNRLAQGRNLIIFPEGPRSVPGKPMKLLRGAAQIALRSGAPLRLIQITCNPPTLGKNEKWYQSPAVKPEFTINVGETLDPNSFMKKYKDFPPAARHLTNKIKLELSAQWPTPIIENLKKSNAACQT